MTAGYLTTQQVETLLRKIKPSRVLHLDGLSHLAAYDVRAHLNRVFGFARWSGEVVDSWQLFEEIDGEKKWNPEKRGRNGSTYAGWDDSRKISVGYRVRYRLIVHAPDGTELARYTEEGTGDANNFPGTKRADAHDFAVKTAESQAMKRCAINLGDQFGLSLYRNGSMDPVVTVTLVGQPENPEDGPDSPSVDEQVPDVVPERDDNPVPHELVTDNPIPGDERNAYGSRRQPSGPPPTCEELLLDAEHAGSTDALNSLARRAVATHAAGHLTDQQLDAIKGVVTARRADLNAQNGAAA